MAYDAGSVVPPIRAALRRPGLMRVVMVLLLCIATSLLFVSGIRHVTVKSALVPTFISGTWGVSAKGVTALAANPSIVILSALRGKPFSFLIHQMGKPQRFRNIRVAVELSARGVQPGSQFWQRGRVLFWSYDRAGKQLKHLEHVVGAVSGTTDWRRRQIIVPVVPETAFFRLILYHGGRTGVMLVRNLTVDDVAETRLFTVLKYLLMVLWAAVAGWILIPIITRMPLRPVPVATLLVGAVILAGILTPQPHLSNFLKPMGVQLKNAVMPFLPYSGETSADMASAVPANGKRANGQGAREEQAPKAERGGAGAGVEGLSKGRRLTGQKVSFVPDWAPRFGIGNLTLAGHFLAFATLGIFASLAYSRVPGWQLLGYLFLFSLAGETLQYFYFTRTVEAGDLIANALGLVVGMGLIFFWRRWRLPRMQPSLPD
jgi:hypothetical protein